MRRLKHTMRGILVILLFAACNHSIASELILNGTGTREAFFIDLYTCELWVPERVTRASDILQSDKPVRVDILVHGNPPGQPPEIWADLLREELSDRLFKITKRTYRNLEESDEISISYPGVPVQNPATSKMINKGTQVSINGEYLFTDPGRSLIEAILEQWLGTKPVSDRLKTDLLGQR